MFTVPCSRYRSDFTRNVVQEGTESINCSSVDKDFVDRIKDLQIRLGIVGTI